MEEPRRWDAGQALVRLSFGRVTDNAYERK